MSSESGGVEKAPTRWLGGAKSYLEVVSFAVFDKKTKKWERSSLKPDQETIVKNTLEVIRQNAQVAEALNKGAYLEVTKRGIYLREGNKIRNILDDKRIKGTTRSKIRKTLLEVTEFASKKLNTKSEVAIEIHTVDPSKRIANYGKTEKLYLKKVKNALEKLSEERTGLRGEDFQDVVKKLQALHEAAVKIYEAVEQKNVENVPQNFEAFCEALRAWQPSQKLLTDKLGDNPIRNPFQFDLIHPTTLYQFFNEVFMQRGGSPEDLEKIRISHTRYLNHMTYQSVCRQDGEQLDKEEGNFLNEVNTALTAFNNPDFTSKLKLEGFSQEEIDEYIKKLEGLQENLQAVQFIIKDTKRYFELGDYEKGIAHYRKEMTERLPKYEKALSELIVPQRVAANRLRNFPSFLLNLDRIPFHQTFLKALDNQQRELDLKIVDFSDLEKFGRVQKERFDQNRQFKRISGQLNELIKKEEIVWERRDAFIKAFESERDLFNTIMRQKGYTDLETAAYFSHLIDWRNAYQSWHLGIKEAIDLANRRDYEGAIEKFIEVTDKSSLKINEAVLQVLPFTERFTEEKLEEAVKSFGAQVGIRDSAQIFQDLQPARFTSNLLLEVEGIEQALKRDKIEPPKTFGNLLEKMKEQTRENNRKVDEQRRLYEQSKHFEKLYTIVSSHKTLGPLWKRVLKKNGWDEKTVKQFDAINIQLATLIQPLQEGEHALAREKDPRMKRVLRAQLRDLAIKLHPEVKQVEQKLRSLQGGKRSEGLYSALVEFEKEVSKEIDNLKKKLEEDFKKYKSSYRLLGIDSPEKIAENVQKIRESEISKQFEKPLKWVEELKDRELLMTSMVREESGLQKLMSDRLEYLEQIYARLHFYLPWQPDIINSTLFSGYHGNDIQFRRLLANKGWNSEKVNTFNAWFNAFNRAVNPVKLARDRLQEDPGSALLQHEFKKVFDQHIGTIDRLATSFEKQFGDLSLLEEGISSYVDILKKSIEDREENLKQAEDEGYIQRIRMELDRAKGSIKVLEEVKFVDQINQMQGWIAEARRQRETPMSWDPHNLDILTDKKVSPLAALLPFKTSDLKKIRQLFRDYQRELIKIHELERKLEAHPKNKSLRVQLRDELIKRRKKLDSLDKRYKMLDEKITSLHVEIRELAERFTKVLEEIKKYDVEGLSEATKKTLLQSKELYRKRSAENLSDAQIEKLIKDCEEINILAIFAEKTGFRNEIYRRHAMR